MTKPFDPYHTWLGIRPEEQPPNHYRLLALQPFEDNADTIEHAADQRMAHLRTLQSGRNSAACQQLLNDVAAAKVCLLNAERKAAYDAALRAAARLPVGQAVAMPLPVAAAAEAMPQVATSSGRAYWRRRQSTIGASVVLGGLLVAGALILLVWAPWREANGDRPREVARQPVVKPAEIEPRTKPVEAVKPAEPKPVVPQEQVSPTEPQPPVDLPVEPPAVPPLSPTDVTATPAMPSDPPPTEPSSPGAPAAPAKLPVPTAAEQQAVFTQIEEVYKVSQTKTPADKLKLAEQLSELARKATQNAAERFALHRKAMELAADGGDLRLAFAKIETIGGEFQIDALTAKETVLTKFAEKAGDADRAKAAVEHALELVDEALREKRYELAQKVATAAVRAAQRTGTPPELRKLATERRGKVQKLFERWQQVEQAQTTLAADPSNPEANLAIGRWKCLVEGDWTAGVTFLTKGSDELLKAAATQEQSGSDTPAERLKRGDVWWDAAQAFAGEEKGAWLRRAAHWYQQMATQDASPLEQAKATKRLDEIAAFQESLLPPEKSPEKAPEKVAKKPGERTLLTPREVMKQFGLAASQWKIEGDVLSSDSAMASEAAYPVTTRPRKLGSFEYGLKMKARSQTIFLVMDGRRYSYARGVRMMFAEGLDPNDRMSRWGFGRDMNARGTRITIDGTNTSRRGDDVAVRDEFCTLAVTLKENTLKLFYQGKEEWSGQIAPPPRGTKHTVQVGFGSTDGAVELKELYFDGE